MEFDGIVGWVGATMILLAYLFLSFNILLPNSLTYNLLNFVGASGIGYRSFKKGAYSPGVLNLIWALIAFIVIVMAIFS